jgi:hypothetical protein
LVHCSYFTLEYVRDAQPFPLAGSGRMQVIVALHGAAILETTEGPQSLRPGDSRVLPASLEAITCRPDGPFGLLLATLPDPS